MTNAPRHTLHIDWSACDGRGLCAEILEHALGRDEWGYPLALRGDEASRSDLPLRPDELDAAEEAVALCPMLALRLQRAER